MIDMSVLNSEVREELEKEGFKFLENIEPGDINTEVVYPTHPLPTDEEALRHYKSMCDEVRVLNLVDESGNIIPNKKAVFVKNGYMWEY